MGVHFGKKVSDKYDDIRIRVRPDKKEYELLFFNSTGNVDITLKEKSPQLVGKMSIGETKGLLSGKTIVGYSLLHEIPNNG